MVGLSGRGLGAEVKAVVVVEADNSEEEEQAVLATMEVWFQVQLVYPRMG